MSAEVDQIHSCSYYCHRPQCVEAQRNALRDRLLAGEPVPGLEPLRGAERNTVRFTIRGEPASKANSRSIVSIGGRPASIKSQKARSFEAVAGLQIPAQARRMLASPVCVELRIWYASQRPDLDESVVLDVLQAKFTGTGAKRKLVRAGVYLNDRQVFEKHVFKGIDPQNPRVEIAVKPIAQSELLT